MATNNSINSNIPIEINKGGSNTTTITNTNGVIFFDGTALSSTLVGAANDVLTSNGAGVAPTFQTSSGTFNFINLPTTTSLNVGTLQINSTRFMHAFGTVNVFMGQSAGNYTLTGNSNIGIGVNTGISLSSGSLNTLIGSNCGPSLSSGSSNVGVGQGVYNTLATGSFNTAVGTEAINTLGGDNNSALGYRALRSLNVAANGNVGVGVFSGQSITSGTLNTAVGENALILCSSGSGNVAIGSRALGGNLSSNNTAVGTDALLLNSSGTNNTAVGFNALESTTTGSANVAVGDNALILCTGGSNTAVGSGSSNTVTSGTANTAVGGSTFSGGGSSNGNTAIGFASMSGTNAACQNNTAVGSNSLNAIAGSDNNTMVGRAAANLLTSGAQNTAIGASVLTLLATGSNNVAVGFNAGGGLTTSDSSNILIGNAGSAGLGNTIIIGSQGTGAGQQDTCFIHGIAGVTIGTSNTMRVNSAGQVGDAISSRRYKDDIEDLSRGTSKRIYDLRPISFTFKRDKIKKINFGLIAEEVAEVIPELVGLDKEGDPRSVDYEGIIPMLLQEIQLLKKRIVVLEGVNNGN